MGVTGWGETGVCRMASSQPDRVPEKEIRLLIVGKSGAGKTSLASSLLTNESTKASYPGTEEFVHCKHGQIEGTPVHLYDTRGIYDGIVSSEKITKAIKQNCPVDQLNAVIVCMRWDERLDEANKEVFRCLNKLNPDIWSNTVFALTFCDHLPPGLKRKSDAEKRGVVNQKWNEWENAIKQELSSLGVSRNVIDSIRMAPTTHRDEDIDEEYFKNIIQSSWLKHLQQIIGNSNECSISLDTSDVLVFQIRSRYRIQTSHLVFGIIVIIIVVSVCFLAFL